MSAPPLSVLTTIPADPGWHCVYAREAAGEAPPVELRPVACWAVVQGVPGAQGPEVCPMVHDAAGGGLPQLRPVVHGAPGYCPPEYLGLAEPGQGPEAWAERARAHLGHEE